MKKITTLLFFVTMIGTKSFALDPQLSIPEPDIYIPDQGVTLILNISGDTAGIGMTYVWQYWDHVTKKWDSIPGSENVPQMWVLQQSFIGSRLFRVNARNNNGHFWPSNSVFLCHYGTLPVTTLQIQGSRRADGAAVLKFQHTMYPTVMLQQYSETHHVWEDIVDVTQMDSYIYDMAQGTLQFRLEAFLVDGGKKYSEVCVVRERINAATVDYTKPIDAVIVTTMAGTMVKKWSNRVFSGEQQLFSAAKENQPPGVYIIVCKQGGVRTTLRTVQL